MGLRNVLKHGDKALLRISREVTDFDARLHSLLDDLKETNDYNEGMGLAAPQVGILRRAIVVTDISGAEDVTIELVNPEIISYSDETEEEVEGCLSVPDVWAMVKRPKYVKVKAQDRSGKPFELDVSDNFLARAVQHEIDHLNGQLFTKLAGKYLSEKEIEEVMFARERELSKRRKEAKAAAGSRRVRSW
ncbi:MAG: peptide deformylase [Oscillospiraceae bacterium]|jgi:peptide deformylase|nr:peptide deformylase [Oscillospiraceae bacterium]